MASYTMELRNYIEAFSQDTETMSHRDRIEAGRSKLFDFDYPIFDPAYKKEFETHFIRNFYNREIGFETEGLFKFKLENWLVINMPYFNQLFKSELLAFDPLLNMKIDESSNKKADKDSKSNSTQDGTGHNTGKTDNDGSLTTDNFEREINSDNPDTRLALTANDGEGLIEYASSIREQNQNNKSDSSSTSTQTSDSTNHFTSDSETTLNENEDYIASRVGKIGDVTYSKMVLEFRQTFLRIEKQIFNEMNELFMLVY